MSQCTCLFSAFFASAAMDVGLIQIGFIDENNILRNRLSQFVERLPEVKKR